MSFVYPKPGAPLAPSGSSSNREDFLALPSFWLHETPPQAGYFTPYYRGDHSDPEPDGLEETQKLPEWWDFDFRVARPLDVVLEIAFRVLCLVSLGHPNLTAVWNICNSDEDTWIRAKDRLWNRINTITIIAGLLLGSTAAFATTSPPRPDLVDYTTLGSYRCTMASFGITLGSLVVGSTVMFVMTKCHAKWFRETLMGSRSRVCCTLIIVAYPFVMIGAATVILALGLLAAAWRSQDPVLHTGGPFMVLVPCMLIPMFLHTQMGGDVFVWGSTIWIKMRGVVSCVTGLTWSGIWRPRKSVLGAEAA
ncbi:hypothetical protein DENSPDRAFT_615771 [Dentipellis sp. KUC8613]|nr:hypothetical protein DENSPDRAFT_615771 [Dentipellis sp. KUC8613]